MIVADEAGVELEKRVSPEVINAIDNVADLY
jgi:hypothetical protein